MATCHRNIEWLFGIIKKIKFKQKKLMGNHLTLVQKIMKLFLLVKF